MWSEIRRSIQVNESPTKYPWKWPWRPASWKLEMYLFSQDRFTAYPCTLLQNRKELLNSRLSDFLRQFFLISLRESECDHQEWLNLLVVVLVLISQGIDPCDLEGRLTGEAWKMEWYTLFFSPAIIFKAIVAEQKNIDVLGLIGMLIMCSCGPLIGLIKSVNALSVSSFLNYVTLNSEECEGKRWNDGDRDD